MPGRLLSFTFLIFCLVVVQFFTGCATSPKSQEDGAFSLDKLTSPDEEVVLSQEASDALQNLIRSIHDEFEKSDELEEQENKTSSVSSTETLAKRKKQRLVIPIEMNQEVKKWIHYFTVKDRDRFHRFLKRGEFYREVVENTLKDHGLPKELYYLAMIESGYQHHATSHASAVGVWQFMKGTGIQYGLDTNYYVDERRDPIRASEAAARYLRDLHNVFHDWYLAMAAYNAGQNRVMGAIMRSGTRDYWNLVKKRALPRETSEYVPKFIAAVMIGKNAEKFGFHDLKDGSFPDVESVEVPSPLRLVHLSRYTGLSVSEIKKVNPHLLRGILPPNAKTYELWVPSERVSQVKKATSKLAQYRLKGIRNLAYVSTKKPSNRSQLHRVKRGENLYSIAKRYRVSVAYLKKINGLRSSHIQAGQKLKVYATRYKRNRYVKYKVRRGDNLTRISQKFSIPVKRIKKANRLRTNRIYYGQILKINTDS